jgi:hypothetical protein
MPKFAKLLLCGSAFLFFTLFPRLLDVSDLTKILATTAGFFGSFNIVDLVILEPVKQLSLRDFMFYLTTATRADHITINKQGDVQAEAVKTVPMWIFQTGVKFVLLTLCTDYLQGKNLSTMSLLEYYLATLVLTLSLYFLLSTLVGTIGLFWEIGFGMKSRPIFIAPHLATSPRDFWSRRWNMFFRDFFHKLLFKDAKSFSKQRLFITSLGIFVVSGALHEYICWCVTGKVTGHNFMFFTLHGIITILQTIFQKIFPASYRVPSYVCIPLTFLVTTSLNSLFFIPFIENDFMSGAPKSPISVQAVWKSIDGVW